MKAKAILSMLALMLLLGVWGCLETDIGNVDDSVDGEGEGEGETEGPTLGDVSGSECKPGTKHTSKAKHHGESEDGWEGDDGQDENWDEDWDEGDEGWGDNYDEPYYGGAIKAQVHENWVRILHMDATYQCEAEIIYMLEANGSELILTEVDSSNVETYCTCNFDLSVDILGLTPGQRYHAEVWNENKSEMFGEVEFTVGDCDIYEKECSYDYECWEYFEEMGGEMPMIDCEGDFACVDGYCEWVCWEYPEYCESDYDCPEGYFCNFMDYGYPEGDCWVDEAGEEHCEDIMPEMIGVCEPREWEEYCESDADCPAGYMCMIEYWDDDTDPDDLKEDCWINDNGEEECVPNPGMPPYYGYCVPVEEPMFCEMDEDCWRYDYPHPECEGEWECVNNMCEWNCETHGDYECWSDEDCGYGQVCTFWEDCEEWDEGMECYGGSYCEAQEPPAECMDDADCPAGYFCALMDCYDETDPEGNATDCYPYGVCMPKEEPPMECRSDADCWEYDMPHDDCVGNWACVDGMCDWYCDQGQYECDSDADCPAGFACEYYEECWDEDGNFGNCVGGSVCAPYEEPPMECVSDDECPEGFFCDNWDPNGVGQCVEQWQGECRDNSQCPEDMFCNIMCGNGWCYGECAPKEEPPAECRSNDECWEIMGPPTIECMGAMWVCENAQCVETCGMECSNNADCPADMFCEMTPDGFGFCQEEEVPGPECEVDSDCAPGEFCAYINCEPDANGDPSNCAPYAVCIPYEDPEPIFCGDNGWCPEGMQCDWCPPDPDCPECEVCGQPVCVR